ncbi:phosphatase PAP2 family protein [Dellaglioa carnosa]|uniref:phosphatase PAP2 family protein n=1 Tax=Dellaglioa carnosa TaxID=2995136 RepID=UPI0022A82AD5|nr:phosphatase PAP2 family protein [Dellaglioa carnosa]MCZ2492826.1 phosphatase PAP2 family protein [Dellaglioa carnosa]
MENRQNKWLVSGIIGLLLFIGLAISVSIQSNWLITVDFKLQTLISSLVSPSLTKFFSLISITGSPVFVIGAATCLMLFFTYRRDIYSASFLGLALIGGDALAFIAKEVIQRPRPTQRLVAESGFSFPSGHAIGSTILVIMIFIIIIPKIKSQSLKLIAQSLAIIWLIIIIFSRVYLRAHFPSDIVGALILGVSWVSLLQFVYLNYGPLLLSKKGFTHSNK